MNRRSFLSAALSAAMSSSTNAGAPLALGQLLITGFRGTKAGDPEVDQVCRFLETGTCAGVRCVFCQGMPPFAVCSQNAAGHQVRYAYNAENRPVFAVRVMCRMLPVHPKASTHGCMSHFSRAHRRISVKPSCWKRPEMTAARSMTTASRKMICASLPSKFASIGLGTWSGWQA